MSKINVLDKSIYNLISAGEVVENPASALKELVENSIDAGATNITIEIESGGITKIKITDNGHGINKQDLTKAFMPHATSKITTADDLNSIGTLGFRGEALSSIAAVSRVTMISKTKDSDTGQKIIIEGGEIQGIEPSPAVNGTTMLIENLFYNVPARAKFLKKPKQEESQITNYISRLILSNPNISFKYVADEKTVFQSFGNGLYEAIYNVYGKSIVDNLIDINVQSDEFKLSGYVGKPTFSKPNRTYQTLVINNRYVINHQISAAVFRAFENFLMRNQFPFFVLHLEVALDKVDVNVHPNKLEVKFEKPSTIFGFVLNAISDSLYQTNFVKNINEFKSVSDINKSEQNNNLVINNNNTESSNTNITPDNEADKSYNEDTKHGKEESYKEKLNDNLQSLTYFLSNDKNDYKNSELRQDAGFAYSLAEFATTNKEETVQEKIIEIDNMNIVYIGKVFGTYLLVQKNQSMFLIDQHAAHERIIYDQFVEAITNNSVHSQALIIPHILELNAIEKDFFENNLYVLENFGFEIEEFGMNSYKITSVPLLLAEINLKTFFDNFLTELSVNSTLKKEDVLKDYLAKSACKNAVKANDELSKSEIEKLLNDLETTKTLLCPHGRPIIVEVTKKEIEKWFKRIV